VVQIDIKTIDQQFSAFRRRVDLLKGTTPDRSQAAEQVLETTLAELELAEEELQVCIEEINSNKTERAGDDEWRLLTKMFAEMPVPVLLLDTGGSIRRCNAASADLLAAPQKYLVRRPLAGLIDLAGRSAYRSALSRIVREGGTESVPVHLAAHRGDRDVVLVLRRITLRDETQRAVIAVVQEAPDRACGIARSTRPAPTAASGMALMLNACGSVARATVENVARMSQALTRADADIGELRKALETRSVIGQATGILMAQRGVTADKAFDLLVRASQNQNVKLNRLARRLVSDPNDDHGI
jgi:AmiR/NasT family two-component response regulator